MLLAKSSRWALSTASRGTSACTQNAIPTPMFRFLVQQSRASSFLNDNSIPSRNRKPQTGTRESWFSRRRKQRNARSKISTLALDPQSMGLPKEQAQSQEAAGQSQRQKDGEYTQSEYATRKLNPRTRRVLIWCAVLSMPIWGQDILEAVVPGALGVFLFVASKIKAGVIWIRSPFGSSEPNS